MKFFTPTISIFCRIFLLIISVLCIPFVIAVIVLDPAFNGNTSNAKSWWYPIIPFLIFGIYILFKRISDKRKEIKSPRRLIHADILITGIASIITTLTVIGMISEGFEMVIFLIQLVILAISIAPLVDDIHDLKQ